MDSTVTVVENESVGPDTYAVTFDSPDGFDARPGQFVKLSADVEGEGHARFYTLSSPDTDETFETTIEVDEEGGPFSAYLAGLEAGDEVAVEGPYGDHHYEGEARVVVLAGGPGVGPAVAIGEAAVADGKEAAVVYAHEGMPAHQARLNELESAGVSVMMVDAGDVDAFEAAVDEVVTTAPGEQLFVYGFAEFVAAASEAVEAAGGDAAGAKVENFG
ncbi:FAD-dependent oxidoreductase [Halolamina sp.]|jgi:Flavodoxin reductases (ferredoxin-NADPH reductases) family 1|uniref:FAD-dependent oxidoreductase n=1 Tax=Halolamina sp. TaxID=1940283 RepID=UPI000223B8FC|nr:Oxidoreductase FAD-binding domain protein [halophilic archaeon DL31]